MDGFQAERASPGMFGARRRAATNRAGMIDRALLRPGRFDRRVEVETAGHDRGARGAAQDPRAQQAARARRRPVAGRTRGLSGAELAAVLEEAAPSAAVRNDTVIDAEDIEISRATRASTTTAHESKGAERGRRAPGAAAQAERVDAAADAGRAAGRRAAPPRGGTETRAGAHTRLAGCADARAHSDGLRTPRARG